RPREENGASVGEEGRGDRRCALVDLRDERLPGDRPAAEGDAGDAQPEAIVLPAAGGDQERVVAGGDRLDRRLPSPRHLRVVTVPGGACDVAEQGPVLVPQDGGGPHQQRVPSRGGDRGAELCTRLEPP